MTGLGVFDNVDTPQRLDVVQLVDVIVGNLGSSAAVSGSAPQFPRTPFVVDSGGTHIVTVMVPK